MPQSSSPAEVGAVAVGSWRVIETPLTSHENCVGGLRPDTPPQAGRHGVDCAGQAGVTESAPPTQGIMLRVACPWKASRQR